MSAKHFHAHWLPETGVAPPTSPGAAFLTFFCLPWLALTPLIHGTGCRWYTAKRQ